MYAEHKKKEPLGLLTDILIDDVQRISGTFARSSSIAACAALAELMKTIFGPKSNDKLFMKNDGDLIITNDGATALSLLVSSL
jgi:chaperonin GroEL (HSP60 family)